MNFTACFVLLFFFSAGVANCIDDDNRNHAKSVFYPVATGFLRSVASFTLEYPAEVVLTRMQSKTPSAPNSLRGVIKSIYSEQGIRGFYAGLSPKASSIVAKNSYQWTLLGLCPGFFQRNLPSELQNPLYPKIFTGITLGLTDAFLTPFERWKVHIITSPSGTRENFKDFLKRPKVLHELFKGSNAVFWASTLTWVNFLVIDHLTNEHMNKGERKNTGFLTQLFVTTGLVSFTETFLTLPFMMLQTQYQKAKDPMKNTGILKGLVALIKTGGVKTLYTGWKIDLFSTLVNSFFDVYFLNFLDHKIKNNDW